MKFKDFPYHRPNMDDVQQQFSELIAKLTKASNKNEALDAIQSIQQLQENVNTAVSLSSVRHTINTNDEFYNEEKTFWDEMLPQYNDWVNNYYEAVLDSPFRDELEEELPHTLIKMMELRRKTFDPKIIPLLQTENRLVTEYNRLIASAELEYRGETYNLAGIGKFSQSTNRQERKDVQEIVGQFFEEHLAEFDRIYDELVKVRHQMAMELGYKDFVEMGYDRMTRFDYSREDVETYRQDVLKYIVPLADKVYQLQSERIGIDEMKYYDLTLSFKDGNPTPKGTEAELVQAATRMYHEMSPETAEFIDFMNTHELMDLSTKPGKQSGGYCTYLPNFKSPFIFANFNGTSGDVDVLTHEVGHALQVYQSRWVSAPEIIWPTYEACEIHSMSMEFFAWPWMDYFFKEDTEKYKYSHLTDAITFLPYGVLVDHFQHEVYEHPEMTPEERRQTWRRLEKTYLPWKEYVDNPVLENGGFWLRQGHIFGSPFYYIDYTLAQVCALQFWQRAIVQENDSAWSDYLSICRFGGTKTFLEFVSMANLKSPFEPDFLDEVSQSVNTYIDEHASQFS